MDNSSQFAISAEDKKISFHFDDQFQQGVLELMVKDADFCQRCSYLLKDYYFANQHYGWFFNCISRLFVKFDTAPSPMQLVNEIMTIKDEERPPYTALWHKIIVPNNVRNYQYIRSNLTQFVKRAKIWQINRKIVTEKFTDPDKLFEYVSGQINEYGSISFESDEFLTPDDIDSVMAESADLSKNLIPTGLPTIDTAMGGGLPRGTLSTVLGSTNVGKSIWLVNFAHNCIVNGFKALYVNLEGQKNQPLLRLISRGIRVPYGNVRFNRLNEVEMKRKAAYVDAVKDRIQIKHVNSFGYSVEELYAYCRTKMEDFKFDVLVVDYGQLLSTKTKQDNLRHVQTHVHRCLANIASNLEIAVVTVAQGTRDVQSKNRRGSDLLRMDDISECFEISRVSAQVLTLNRSETDEANDRVRILLEKQRDGLKGIIEICRTDFKTISMYGTAEEGLGFLSPDEFLAEELAQTAEQDGEGRVSPGLMN